MFKPAAIFEDKNHITIHYEGKPCSVPAGITVAAAVMGYAGEHRIRQSPVTGEPRAPFCFMGVCHECLMEIDGVPDQQACLIEVKEGMTIRLQSGLPEAER